MGEIAMLSQVGPYRIERELGRGGMGVVYLARDTALDRHVAIKAMAASVLGDPLRLGRFEREAKLLASLNHPNIAAIYALLEHEASRYLVLEYVDGRMLKEVLRQGPLPPADALSVCGQIAAALDAAHRAGVMHRDLKPGNVGFGRDGLVKVLDFGLAKSLQEPARPDEPTVSLAPGGTLEGTVVGTPGYMSPEQTRGLPADHRADVWSLGCMLYECLAGRPAFTGSNSNDVMAATLYAEPAWDALPPGTPPVLRDLLKACLAKDPAQRPADMARVRTVLDAAAGGGPTVSAVARPEAGSHNLPAPMTSFVGRRREMAQLRDLLGGTRLLTLTGAGGCGKTRLALELAARIGGQFPDGIWFAELASLTDPAMAPKSVATALGIKEIPGETLVQTLVRHLRQKRTLLLLDNCEHLLGACAELAHLLLHACPELSVMATSREGLGIAGETTFRVPSLSCPNGEPISRIDELAAFEAVQLFVDRARAARPDFELSPANAAAVRQICQRLDGIPLAIELAAARVRALPIDQIAARLDDSFRLLAGGSRTALPRQQTLRATIDWSYNLLAEPEKALLRRLSVFAGGWTLGAAETICADAALLSQGDILDVLTALVDRSLVAYEEPARVEARYRLLNTVRQYAAEALQASGESSAVRLRHLDYFIAMASEAQDKLRGPEQLSWLNRLEVEHDNIHRALAYCDVVEDGAHRALVLAGSLWRFWEIHGHLATGSAAIEAALARPQAQAASGARAAALSGAGFMALMRGEYPKARALLEQGLEIRRALGDRTTIAGSLSNLGIVLHNQGDYARARALHGESLAIRRELNDIVGITTSLICLANVARTEGRLDEARSLYEEGMQVQAHHRDKYLTAHLITNLGVVAQGQDLPAEARRHMAEGLALRREIRDKRGVARSLEAIAGLAVCQSDARRAARLLGAAERVRDDIGCIIQAADRGRYDRDLAATRAALPADEFDRLWLEGRSMSIDESTEYALKGLAEQAPGAPSP